jgi:hypothetical protein
MTNPAQPPPDPRQRPYPQGSQVPPRGPLPAPYQQPFPQPYGQQPPPYPPYPMYPQPPYPPPMYTRDVIGPGFHILNIALTLFTCGLWLPGYLILWYLKSRPRSVTTYGR